jgi:hypothetical protein
VLGRSETVTVSQRATWIATGNNIQLRGDLPRRCYWIRLDARESRPWQRQNFRHPDLLGWVTRNRGRLVHALLTLARGWVAAGKPKASDLPQLGSFEAWTEIVGGMVAYAGIPGFLGNLSALYDKADEGNAEWEEFLLAWWETFEEEPVTVAQLAKRVETADELREALPPDLAEAFDKSKGSFSRRLGNALSKRSGTRYGEDALRVVKAGELRRAVRWKLDKGSSECEFVSFVSLYNPSAGKNSGENGGAEPNCSPFSGCTISGIRPRGEQRTVTVAFGGSSIPTSTPSTPITSSSSSGPLPMSGGVHGRGCGWGGSWLSTTRGRRHERRARAESNRGRPEVSGAGLGRGWRGRGVPPRRT